MNRYDTNFSKNYSASYYPCLNLCLCVTHTQKREKGKVEKAGDPHTLTHIFFFFLEFSAGKRGQMHDLEGWITEEKYSRKFSDKI